MLSGIPERAAIALLVAGASCGPGFIEPNPPELSLLTLPVELTVRAEPVVYAVFFDLNVASEVECANAIARYSQVLSAAVASPQVVLQLQRQEISPVCRQSFDRTFDLSSFEVAWAAVEARWSGFQVRPLILYLNNVDLPLPPRLVTAFEDLDQHAAARGALRPIVWAITTPTVAAQRSFDQVLDWTYLADPDLTRSLTGLSQAQLPLWSVPLPVTAQPLLGDGRVRQLKRCDREDRVIVGGVPPDGSVAIVDSASPPRWWVSAEDLQALPRTIVPPWPFTLRFETCLANCDRMIDDGRGPFFRWNERVGCLVLDGGAP